MASLVGRTDLAGLRASGLVVCPRREAYRAAGAPELAPGDETDDHRLRGNALNELLVRPWIEARYEAVRAEVEIPWGVKGREPLGTGHADYVARDERGRLVLEVTTTVGEPPQSKYDQAVLYAISGARPIGRASVITLDISTLRLDVEPVNIEARAPYVRELLVRLQAALDDGELPPRVCRHRFDGPSRFCDFAEHCFADYEPEPIASASLLEDTAAAIAKLRREIEERQAELDELRDALRPFVDVGKSLRAGGYRISRSHFERRTFSLSRAEKAGWTAPPEFISTSEVDRVDVRVDVSEVPAAADDPPAPAAAGPLTPDEYVEGELERIGPIVRAVAEGLRAAEAAEPAWPVSLSKAVGDAQVRAAVAAVDEQAVGSALRALTNDQMVRAAEGLRDLGVLELPLTATKLAELFGREAETVDGLRAAIARRLA